MEIPTETENCAEVGIVKTESVRARSRQAGIFFIIEDIRF
jgi:hypothetical protein